MQGRVARNRGNFRVAMLALGVASAVLLPQPARASHPAGLPLLSSDPGAAYTVYLDFGGFTFTGTWGNSGSSPGTTPAYDDATSSFSTGEISNIQNVWARVCQKYTGFNVNVTTVDPAVAAGQAATDAQRQAFYDSTPQMMHTVIGGLGAWSGGGGVSYVGVTKNSYNPAGINSNAGPGFHTDWVFSDEATSNLQFIGEATSHENGHGFGLNHQSDFTGTTLVNEYSTNNSASGPGSYAPIMGDSYSVQRSAGLGNSDSGGGVLATQNDVKTIVGNPNMNGFVNDAIGHNGPTATPLPLNGSSVNPGAAHGWITPVSPTSPNPIGASNYTTDFFSFSSDGVNPISLTVNDGTEFLNVGAADPGATLESTLQILSAPSGTPVGSGVLSANTLSETYIGTLPAGTYYAEVGSYGGYTSTFDTSAQYYDMGAYFITGAVPEPAVMMLIPLAGLLVRRRGA